MATTINADTSSGLILTSDTSGIVQIQSSGTTRATINSTGISGDGSQLTNLPADATKLPLAGGTLTGNITLEAVTETKTTKTGSFTPDLNNDGTLYSCSGTMTITMPTVTSGKSFTIIHSGANLITWGGTIKWNGGSAPTAATAIEIYVFVSDGTYWYANQAGTGYA